MSAKKDTYTSCAKRLPECDLITERAKNELEKAAMASNNELKMALASLAQSMKTTNESMNTLAETVKADHELVVESQRQWHEMQEWQKQQSIFRDTEEREKKEALVEVEKERKADAKTVAADALSTAATLDQQRKDRIRPVIDRVWNVVQWIVIFILGIAATAIWNQYFR